MKKILFVLFLLSSSTFFSQIQRQISFNQLSVEDGLSQNSVVSIAQDSTGYLWLATQDGLNMYDGKKFKYYQKLFEDITKEDYSKLGKVFVDRENTIYIISKSGVFEVYNRVSDSFQKIERFRNVSTYFQDSNLNKWIGTYGHGLYYIDNKSKDTLQVLQNSDKIKEIYAISEHENKIIVAASNSPLEIEMSSLEYKKIPFTSAKSNTNFSSIATKKNSQLWLGSFGNGLFSQNSNTLKKFSGFSIDNQIPLDLNIQTLFFDSKDRLWVGTYGHGAYLIDFLNQTISTFSVSQVNPKALHYNDILCIYEDYTGTIWLGTDGAGLSYYDENLNKFNVLTNYEVPSFADVAVTRAITVDPAGNFWIGTSGKGLTFYNPTSNKFISYKHDPSNSKSINSNRVMSLLNDENEVWVGSQDQGLGILKNGLFRNYNENTTPPLYASTIWTILKDNYGNYWLGTRDNGLIQFDPNKGVVAQFQVDLDNARSISSNNIRTIIQGDSGVLWIGTENNGLNKFLINEKTFVQFTNDEIANIKSLYYDNKTLWIGTNGNGLQAFDTTTETIHGYDTNDGLPNNVVYSILPDDEKNLWLSSNRGITMFSLNNFSEKPKIINYDTYDGLQALEFNTGAAFKDAKGTLYFGGLNGINWFKPNDLSNNPVPPKTIISNVEIFGEAVPFRNISKFNYSQNTVTFNFAALHFSQPERNQYKYSLINYDVKWSKPSTTSFARYTNLPPGDYTFKVLSSNYDGVWAANPAAYSFTITPPWYLTTMAKIGYALAFLLLLGLLYTYLKWRWHMQVQLQLEHRETERLKKMDELKTKLYTNISHEFRTPLTLISGPVQELLSKTGITDTDKKSLSIIETSSKRMLRLVNQLLDLSKLESKAVTLQVGSHDLNPQLTQIVEAFALQANEKGITITADIAVFSETWYDTDILEKIVFNLMSNAIKYAPENSEVLFKAEKKDTELQIIVTNETSNLPSAQITKLFDRFYQVDRNSEGVGIGLSLIKELTSLCNGTVNAAKTSSDKITFTLSIPIEKNDYNENEIIKEKPQYNFVKNEVSEIFIDDNNEIPIILIVEDNTDVRNYLVSLFDTNYSVIEAEDGLVGIKKALRSIPDLIISDIMMPNKDGIELCNTLKQDVRTSHIPIVLITAKADDESELVGLRSRADDYVTKPFNAEIVKQKVKNIIALRRELQDRYSQNVFLRPSDIAIVPADEAFLENVQVIIDTKMSQPDFTSEDFSKELHLSRMQLHRKLKALTGLSTSEFIRSQRLKSAVRLIENSDLSISEIGYMVGFNTPSYFTKCFREVYNCAPSEYENSNTND